ncbi:PEP-CTERM sorting domain-containing protein [Plectonema cf. radiosum LEGE 06105]|uniref:PEP-CTERM sorting domain-containing protein n=1 Tax=Plectonema cf. radiosum LEGE 06105 TaxID=945769 RepID=A0A8J7F2L6_9CYAN|nr:choice-of-anchor W domain-containing protein [Plectonema radiosum]MBE9213737.1 PEP-CTERM sorting domain-containing protein [Plectonema cf. radiosum LEGE 06105]
MLRFNQTNQLQNSLCALGLTALGLFIVPESAQAFTLVDKTGFTDIDFNQQIADGTFSELFVAEGRIGDRGGAATYELSINDDVVKGARAVTEEQFNWENGKEYEFSLEYDGNMVNYILGGETLSTSNFSSPINSIFFRTSAGKNTATSLTNLMFNGGAIGSLSSSLNDSRDIDYLQIKDISSPFIITGKASMVWQGIAPKNSLNAFQIKVGNSPKAKVPEPVTIGAIFVTGMAGLGLSKNKKKNED